MVNLIKFVNAIQENHISNGFVLSNGAQFYAAKADSDGYSEHNLPVDNSTQRVMVLFNQKNDRVGMMIAYKGMKTYFLERNLKRQYSDLKQNSGSGKPSINNKTFNKRSWYYDNDLGKVVVP